MGGGPTGLGFFGRERTPRVPRCCGLECKAEDPRHFTTALVRYATDHPSRFGGWVRGHRKVASAFLGGIAAAQRTYVYVDGFNLYYGALRRTPYRWLNLAALCRLYLQDDDVLKIKYFTAIVSARPSDPDQPLRQQLYLRALRTLPEVEIFYGHFLSNPIQMPLAPVPANQPALASTAYLVPGGPRKAWVVKTEEKGSDVNLATHLLYDSFANAFDAAVLITNDSDLLEPIRLVRGRLGKKVGILNPHPNPSWVLYAAATFKKKIRAAALRTCQFPATLTDANGTFHKPPRW